MKLKNIQILRALAANSVIVFHLIFFEQKYGNEIKILPFFLQFLSCGVDLFFVISGFIMAIITSDSRISWKNFLFARFSRIYPIYWLYTSVMLATFFIFPSIMNTTKLPSLWQSYTLFPGKLPPLLPVGWTLIHEMYFYLTITVIIAFQWPLKYALLIWTCLIMTASIALDRNGLSPMSALFLHPSTLEFIMGVYAGIAIGNSKREKAKYSLWGGLAALTFSAINFGYIPIKTDWLNGLIHADNLMDMTRSFLFGLPCAFIVFGAAKYKEIKGFNLIKKIGDASYSIYLSHILVLSSIGKIFYILKPMGLLSEILYVAGGIVAANIFGLLSYSWLEIPIARALQKIKELSS